MGFIRHSTNSSFLLMLAYLQWFRFLRPFNLLIIGLTQSLVFWYMSNLSEANKGFSLLLAFTLVFSSMLAAAAGYVINDIYDAPIDAINKKDKPLIVNVLGDKSKPFYYAILGLSLITAFCFDLQIQAIWFSVYQIIIAILLFLYAKYFKKIALLGNLLVSFLCALVVMIVLFAFVVVLPQSIDNQFIWLYVLFAFLSNLFREIIKDIEDIEGDNAGNCKTLPILVGIKATKGIAILVLIILSATVFLSFGIQQYQTLSSLIIILAFALIFQTFKTHQKQQFHRISQVTKLLMLLGLLYLVI